ncbi:MAG: hypothetical protein H6587_06690 [Flavobacteriales bacterium]|nr:hypothetical protein [Flavobacteriales bacterium]
MIIILSLQLLISPLIAYHYYNNDMEFTMYIDESPYILFVLIYIIFFSIGLFVPIIKPKNTETFYSFKLEKNHLNGTIGLFLIIFGFISYFIGRYTPASLHFVFYLFSYARFIGAFILIFSYTPYRYIIALAVFLHFTYLIVSSALFYDLIIWGFFFYMVIELKIQSSFPRKMLILAIGGVLLMLLQSVKSEYRKEIWDKNNDVTTQSNFEKFVDVTKQRSSDLEEKEKSNLEHLITRLNTGWIISCVLVYVPSYQPITNGEVLKEDLKSVFIPRFLSPNKKSVGGDENRAKFEQFTGRRLGRDTTMRIGVLADAYINYGYYGGAILMLLFGLIINIIIQLFKAYFYNSINYLWLFFIFSFTIRMSDFLVILNSTLKSFIIFLVIRFILEKFIKEKYNPSITN